MMVVLRKWRFLSSSNNSTLSWDEKNVQFVNLLNGEEILWQVCQCALKGMLLKLVYSSNRVMSFNIDNRVDKKHEKKMEVKIIWLVGELYAKKQSSKREIWFLIIVSHVRSIWNQVYLIIMESLYRW